MSRWAMVVFLVALAFIVWVGLAAVQSPAAVIVNRSGGFPSDPNLIWCGSGDPHVHPPCSDRGGRDHPSSPIPCRSGPDQVADCIH